LAAFAACARNVPPGRGERKGRWSQGIKRKPRNTVGPQVEASHPLQEIKKHLIPSSYKNYIPNDPQPVNEQQPELRFLPYDLHLVVAFATNACDPLAGRKNVLSL
jgi:hypothetical protein